MARLTFLYVLTSNGDDTFIDMTYLSAAFLRFNHPRARILILCDRQSYAPILSSNHALLSLVDDVIHCDTPRGRPAWRNRYVKCRLRELVTGDCLYLDADTIPVRRLDEIFDVQESFAAAMNHSREITTNFGGYEKEIFDRMHWQYPAKYYLNAGVLFWKEVDESHALAAKYIDKWTQSSRAGYHYDQPSLNAAFTEWTGSFHILDNKFNAQFITNLVVAIDAHLWHLYASEYEAAFYGYFASALRKIGNGETLEPAFLKNVHRARIPFETKSQREEDTLVSLINDSGKDTAARDFVAKAKILAGGVTHGYHFLSKLIRSPVHNTVKRMPKQ